MRHILCVTLLSLGPDLPQVAMRLLGFLFVAARGAGQWGEGGGARRRTGASPRGAREGRRGDRDGGRQGLG